MGTKNKIKQCYPPETDAQLMEFAIIINALRYKHGLSYQDIKEFFADAIGEAIILSDWDGFMYELEVIDSDDRRVNKRHFNTWDGR